MKKTVFIGATGYETYCAEGRNALLEAGYTLIENQTGRPYTKEELKEIGGEISGVICGCEIWDEETISAAPDLEVIIKFGVGYDNIDSEAAKRHGVQAANCPGMNSAAVAEQTMALLLACMREVPALDRSVRQGNWERRVFPEISGSVFGVLGFGAAGRAVAKCARAFGAQVIAYDKYPDKRLAEELGVSLCSVEEIFSRSDIISIHLPALAETRHLINKETIGKMRKGVVMVNTARGMIVDEEAVAEALKSGKIYAYGTDVYEKEPVKGNSPLLYCPHTVLSPHLAGESLNSYSRIGMAAAQGIIAALSGKELPNRVI